MRGASDAAPAPGAALAAAAAAPLSPRTGSPTRKGPAGGAPPAPPTPSGGAGSAWGTGGMATKIKAAQLATAAGCTVVVMNTARIELLEASLAHASAAVTVRVSDIR